MEDIKIKEYDYVLPPERIARYPLEKRDESKLLVYQAGTIAHTVFKSIDAYLPANSLLFFNNTRVIPARLIFKKESGAEIEIFVLQPLEPTALVYEAMLLKSAVSWQCTIGNLKRWPDALVLTLPYSTGTLQACLTSRSKGIVTFSWTSRELTFAEVIKECGSTPLPPYLKRKAEATDVERYQTIYAQQEGAVAAPTAGLHFTDAVLSTIKKKNIGVEFLTLHVSAGTFLPVKTENALDHAMHSEQVLVQRKALEQLLADDKTVVSVGTTSLRTLESLYWYGVKLVMNKNEPFVIHKMDPYQLPTHITKRESLMAILEKMKEEKKEFIIGETSIYIVPGYQFNICQSLITNFHQPASTLMLLVAAFVGNDWKRIYKEALDANYRFLSYGDSSLLLPQR
jgi:S-adenosylmethionine:tRNA ribosyltransferase-isomerase